MRRKVVAVLVVVLLSLTACDKLPAFDQITGASEPQTLEAATAAAQERADRVSSGDFAGAWLLSSERFQEVVAQADYVNFQEACTTKRDLLPVKVTGVRLDGDNQAIVRQKDVLGIQDSVTMDYEDGKWVQAPAAYWVEHAGWTGDRLIAERKAAGKCSGDSDLPSPVLSTPRSTTDAPTTRTTTNPPAGSCSVNIPGCEGYDECHPVVTGNMDCFPEDESCSKPGNAFPWCPPTVAASPSATNDYQNTVRKALRDAGYEVPDTSGATTVLDEARDLVCQNKYSPPEAVDTQLMEANWFNHPSLDSEQAEAIRTVALNYCPSN